MDSGDEGHRAGDPGALLEPTAAARGRGPAAGRDPEGQAAAAPRRRAADDADDAGDLHARPRPRAPAPTTTAASCSTRSVDQDVWLTGSNVLPGNPNVVHHVILFKISPDDGRRGRGEGRRRPTTRAGPASAAPGSAGEFGNLDDANWLAAWAPGGDETKVQDGYGVKLEAGSRIVMQVHYNLLKGAAPDQSPTQLRWMPGDTDLTPLHTFLHARAGRAALPPRPQRRPAVRPRRRVDRREEAVRHRRQHQHAAAHALRHRDRAQRDHVLHPPGQPRHDRARRGRPHAPARPQDHHRGQPRHRPRRRRCCGSRSGTSTTRAPSRSTRSTSTPATPSASPASTSSGCATSCRRSRPSARTATSSGPRAAPTRCAWACSRWPTTTSPDRVERGRASRSQSFESRGRSHRAGPTTVSGHLSREHALDAARRRTAGAREDHRQPEDDQQRPGGDPVPAAWSRRACRRSRAARPRARGGSAPSGARPGAGGRPGTTRAACSRRRTPPS